MSRRRPRLDRRARLAYAAPAFALAAVGVPIYVHLPKFYTDVVGVPVSVVGLVLMAGRVFDGVIDPLIGWASDRSRSRWGRRRPWIAAAAPPLAVALWLLFTPPLGEGAGSGWWLGATMFAVFLAWSLVTVPYEAMGPELSFDYDGRTSLLALRDGVLLAGTLAAAASPTLAGAIVGGSGAEAEAAKFRLVAAAYAPMILATCAWCAWSVRELASPARRRRDDEAPNGEADAWPRPRQNDTGPALVEPSATGASLAVRIGAAWTTMRANRPFLVLLGSYALSALGSNLPATLIFFYVEYVLESGSADLFLLLYLVTGILFLPMWVRVAARSDKKTAWLGAMALNTGAFLGVWFLGPGDAALYAVLIALSGIGFGATVAIPSSMQADVIDYDELLSGRRREGAYLGVWSVARKAAAALGVGLGLRALDGAGYVPNAPQSAEVRDVLAALYALVPCACNAAGFALALAYPIGRGHHAAILDAIRDRRSGLAVEDPLRPGVVLQAGVPA